MRRSRVDQLIETLKARKARQNKRAELSLYDDGVKMGIQIAINELRKTLGTPARRGT